MELSGEDSGRDFFFLFYFVSWKSVESAWHEKVGKFSVDMSNS